MSRKILMGVLVLILGFLISGSILYYGLTEGMGTSQKFLTPIDEEITLEAGQYTVFHEYKVVVNGEYLVSSSADINGLTLNIENEEGQKVLTQSPNGQFSYNIQGREGYAIFVFEIPETGSYHVTVDNEKEVLLNISSMDFKILLICLLGCMGGVVLTVIMAVVVWMKKSKVENDLYED